MSQHATILLTDGRPVAMCQLEYNPLMTLIVWHRLKGDRSMFKMIFEFARRVEESPDGHPCPQCGAKLYSLAHDPEFRALAVKEKLMSDDDARKSIFNKSELDRRKG